MYRAIIVITMKISITKTELHAMPYIAWNSFKNFLLYGDMEFNSAQKTASLCLKYFFGMLDKGHADMFACGEINSDELTRALVTIDAHEFAENLPMNEADRSREDYEKSDKWYYENAQTLLDAIDKYRLNNLGEFYEIVDENYTIRPPKAIAWLGIFESVFFFALMIIFAVGNPEDIFLICLSFSAIASLGLLLVAYIRIWKVSVNADVLSVRLPFKREQAVRIDGISDIKMKREGIIIYAHGQRLVSIDRYFDGYSMLWAQLWLAEKVSEEVKTDFVIKQHKANIITGFLCPVFGIGAFVWTFTRGYNPANIYEKIFFTAVLIVTSYLPVHYLIWKVMVSKDGIAVRKAIREEKEYQFSDITKVKLDDQNMIVYAGDKKAVKIPLACEGCQELIQRLRLHDIPFFKNGKEV